MDNSQLLGAVKGPCKEHQTDRANDVLSTNTFWELEDFRNGEWKNQPSANADFHRETSESNTWNLNTNRDAFISHGFCQ